MSQSIIIVNIAFGDPDLLNEKTIHAIRNSKKTVLRTSCNPIASWLRHEKICFSALDHLYDTAEDFDQLSSAIAEHLWSLAAETEITYAVPDTITDCSVRMLYRTKPDGGNITVIPGVGLSDVYQSAVRTLMPDSELRTVSAADFLSGDYDPNTSVLITEIDNSIMAGSLKLHLSAYLNDEYNVYFFQERKEPVMIRLFELDRQKHVDHLSALFIPGSGYMERKNFVFWDLLQIMKKLRAPDGCPWDRIQTHRSLRRYMIEEAWECVAAIDQDDPDHLADELGDLLFQIVFHSSIGESYDEFTVRDVIDSVCRKMIRRHPHIFADQPSALSMPSSDEWEKLKRNETGSQTVPESLNDVSDALPALMYASKVAKKLSLLTPFRRKTADILADIRLLTEQNTECTESFIGQILFLYAELCFSLGLDGELLLHNTVTKAKQRIQIVEKELASHGKSIDSLTFPELCVYLNHVGDEIE